jgi:hypothetical protein
VLRSDTRRRNEAIIFPPVMIVAAPGGDSRNLSLGHESR